MIRDAHGLEMTAAAPAVAEGYDRALGELLHYGPDMLSAPQDVLAEDPDCPMGNLLRAYQSLMAAEAGCLGEGRDLLAAFKARVLEERLLPRERAHVRVAEALAREDLRAAAKLLRELNREHPRDALGLYLGHNLDYFTGDAHALRDRIAEALPCWSADDALYAPVLGMYAFGLEEMGDYDGAEEVGGEALSLDPKDVWGLHAVVHTYEMRARFGEGLELFDRRMGDWAEGNYFTVHNWWHYALFNLEAGNLDAVRRIYDERLFMDPGKCVAVKMCDASALLWRLLLDGVDEPERWRELAQVWSALTGPPCYAFNDMHAVMAFVGNGDVDRADGLIADRKRWLAEDHDWGDELLDDGERRPPRLPGPARVRHRSLRRRGRPAHADPPSAQRIRRQPCSARCRAPYAARGSDPRAPLRRRRARARRAHHGEAWQPVQLAEARRARPCLGQRGRGGGSRGARRGARQGLGPRGLTRSPAHRPYAEGCSSASTRRAVRNAETPAGRPP